MRYQVIKTNVKAIEKTFTDFTELRNYAKKNRYGKGSVVLLVDGVAVETVKGLYCLNEYCTNIFLKPSLTCNLDHDNKELVLALYKEGPELCQLEQQLNTYIAGECDVFAAAYQDMFGGDIWAIFEEEGPLVHAWVKVNGVDVDANGKIENLVQYLDDEFGDFWSSRHEEAPSMITRAEALKLGGHTAVDVKKAAEFIKKLKDLYTP